MTYARARLWLGITGVGTMVCWCVVLLALRVPQRFLPTETVFSPPDVATLVGVIFAYAAVQGTFDFFGGHILPTEYGRTTRRLGAFLAGWLRGVAAHSAVLLCIGLSLLTAARWTGFWGAFVAFATIGVLLIAVQAGMAATVGGISYRRDEGDDLPLVVFAQGGDSYFTGGIAGLPSAARIVLPAQWASLSEREQTIIRLRKGGVLRSGARTRGIALALGFNAIGFALSLVAGGNAASVAGLVTTSLWFTLWSFAGLLLLPTPSQRGVFAADAFALENGASVGELEAVIRILDRWQEDEPARPGGVERVFHPLPSVERRLSRLAVPERETSGAAWHTARMAIYLSWAGMSLLSRAVHCNAGRPDAWVFLPSD